MTYGCFPLCTQSINTNTRAAALFILIRSSRRRCVCSEHHDLQGAPPCVHVHRLTRCRTFLQERVVVVSSASDKRAERLVYLPEPSAVIRRRRAEEAAGVPLVIQDQEVGHQSPVRLGVDLKRTDRWFYKHTTCSMTPCSFFF